MAEARKFGGFNTTLQQVDEGYSWINDMIKARQKLVVLYMQLLNLPLSNDESEAERTTPSYEDITKFCDLLIDYVSHGHFDLYPKIVSVIENASNRSQSIARRVLPKIEQTTEYLMRFNDHYCSDLDEGKLSTLKKDLTETGKCLEQRFRAEDRLVIAMRVIHTIASSN
ncbi:MAG: sigma D regulator [Succinivibrionaceae bacterium]|nr:sigma D regulator [Succinivibrionaceae bacterium]